MKGLYLIVLMTILTIGIVGAVECNADLSQGGNSCTVSANKVLTLVNGNYNFNDTTLIGVISITGSNVIFDCNNSLIYGNHTNSGLSSPSDTGITLQAHNLQNISILNCRLQDYKRGINIDYNNNTNILIQNVTVNNSNFGVYADIVQNLTINQLTILNSWNTSNGAVFVAHSINVSVNGFNILNNVGFGKDGIQFNNVTNSSIINGYIDGFINSDTLVDRAGIITYGGSSDILINNITILNVPYNQTGIIPSGRRITVNNINCISNNGCIYFSSSATNSSINNITFGYGKGNVETTGLFFGTGSSNLYIKGVNLTNSNNTITVRGVNNITLDNLYIFNVTIPNTHNFYIQGNANNVFVKNSQISYSDSGIHVVNSNNIIFDNVTIDHLWYNRDGYGVGLLLEKNVSNVLINNSWLTYSNEGILFRGNHLTVTNTRCSSDNFIKGFNARDISSCIIVPELYQTWLGDSTEISGDNRTNKIGNYSSNNITIYGNTYDSSVNVFAYLQGATNVSIDLTGYPYWFRSFQSPTYLVDRTDLYINNQYDNVTSCHLTRQGCSTLLGQGYMSPFAPNYTNYSFFKSYDYFYNTNPLPQITIIYNKTSALLTNGTSICNGSSSNLASNTGNINITLQQNESCYVLDNFNLTEGISRDNSPLNYSFVNLTEKHITNSLSDTLNVTVAFNVSNNPSYINYISNSLPFRHTYYQNDWNYANGILVLNLTNVESTEFTPHSNTLYISYAPILNNMTICNATGFCTNGSSTWQMNQNLTFNTTVNNNENIINIFFQWIVDGVVKLTGFGQSVFSYVFNLPVNHNQSNIELNISNTNQITTFNNSLSTENLTFDGILTGISISWNPQTLSYFNFTSGITSPTSGDIYIDACTFGCNNAFISPYLNYNAKGWKDVGTTPNCNNGAYSTNSMNFAIGDYLCINTSSSRIAMMQIYANKSMSLNFTWNYWDEENGINHVRYAALPYGQISTSGYLNLSGYLSNITYQNISYIAGAFAVTNSPTDEAKATDNDWGTFAYKTTGFQVFLNYTLNNLNLIDTVQYKTRQVAPCGIGISNDITCWDWNSNSWTGTGVSSIFASDDGTVYGDNLWYCDFSNGGRITNVTYSIPETCINRTSGGITVAIQNHLDTSFGSQVSFYEGGLTALLKSYPSNVTFSLSNYPVWSYPNQFNQTNNETNDFSTAINNYLPSCININGFCNVPFIFHSDSAGILEYSDLNIVYLGDTNSTLITITVNATLPIVTVSSPSNQLYNYSKILFNFNATSPSGGVIDSLWFGNGSTNITYTGPVNVTLKDRNYSYRFYANDTAGDNAIPVIVNFTISASPNISIYAPTGIINYAVNGGTILFNWSVYSTGTLDTCWYNYKGSNNIVSCTGNTNIIVNSFYDNNLTFYANDTAGNIVSKYVNWTYYLFNNNVSYQPSSLETQAETFILYGTRDTNVYQISARLNYNGNNYSSTTAYSGTNFTITSIIDVPTTTNVTTSHNFNWTINGITPSISFNVTTENYNQNVSKLYFSQCSSPSQEGLTLNFTTYDTQLRTPLNASFQATMGYFAGSGTQSNNFTFNDITENKSNWLFCLNSTGLNVTLDAFLNYYATGYNSRSYIISHGIIGNFTQNIPLYLDTTNSTSIITFTVTDQNYNPLQGAIVNIQQWNVGTNTYSTIGMFTTGQDGGGLMNLQLYNIWYRAVVTYQGNIVATTGVQKLSSQTWSIVANLATSNPYTLFGAISHGLIFSNLTNITTFTWADSSGYTQKGCLVVQNLTSLGYSTIFSSCIITVSGTINYQLVGDGEYQIYGTIYLNAAYNVSQVTDSLNIRLGTPEITVTVSPFGKVLSFVFIGTAGMIGVAAGSILLGIFLVLGALFICMAIGWLNITMGIIWGIIVIMIVLLLSLRRRNSG